MITAIKLFSGLILGISLAGCVTKDIVIAKSNSDGMGPYEASQESGLLKRLHSVQGAQPEIFLNPESRVGWAQEAFMIPDGKI